MTPQDLRLIAVKASMETAAFLRDMACEAGASERVRGETIRADVEAEEYLVDILRSELGGSVMIVSEERGVEGGPSDLAALVDPLDGSTNFASCISWASVSVAFAARRGGEWRLEAGAVAPVFWGEPVSFHAGGGCYLGSSRVEAKGEPPKVIAVYVDKPGAAEAVALMVRELGGDYKVRSLGSAALEISYVGLGRIAAFIDVRGRLRNVDVAAAVGVVRECGGEVLGDGGSPLRVPVEPVVRVGSVVASIDERVGEVARRLLARVSGRSGG